VSRGENVTAIPADSFIESISIQTHWRFPNIYSNKYTSLKAKLAESGIRHLRDYAANITYIRANDLYNSLGIKTHILVERRVPGPGRLPLDSTQIDEALNEIKTYALASTFSLEAPNEYDLSHGSDTDWVNNIRNFTILLYTKAKSDEKLKNLPIIGPSLTSLGAYEAVGNLDLYLDYVNLHMYQGYHYPGTNGTDENGTLSVTWFLNKLARIQSPSGKSVQATESGYHTFGPPNAISEEADGKYAIRVFAEFFRRGVYRSSKYELVDEGQAGPEGNFGLLRNDLSEKPSFRALKSLISILSDKGSSLKPSTLNYILNGSMDNVRQILFQKRTGDFCLMVWLEVASWNTPTHSDLYPPPQQVVLTLQENKAISSATLYAFNNTADVNTYNLTIADNQVTFNATDKISILKLSTSGTFSH
jgi:hypothetical protein